jgi:hypothetical protein
VRKPLQLAGLAGCLAAGLVLAFAVVGNDQAADTTTTATTTETLTEPTTIVTTSTVEHTTTRQIILPAATTTSSSSSSDNETPTWVWVLLAILVVALVATIGLLASRHGHAGGETGVSPTERRRRLDGAVASWAAQGWALESQSTDTAVLQRSGERMIVGVDSAGHISTRAY